MQQQQKMNSVITPPTGTSNNFCPNSYVSSLGKCDISYFKSWNCELAFNAQKERRMVYCIEHLWKF